MSGDKTWRAGGCHCKAVRFEVRAADDADVSTCNCSMCGTTGFIHLVVDDPDFRIVSGADRLTSYRFNTMTAEHLFCSLCGVKSFYHPRSRPAGWSVNVNWLDEPQRMTGKRKLFDGANWEAHFAAMTAEDRSQV